jgi:hypothetical protein
MSKSNTFENDSLKLYFNASAIANIADNAAAAPASSLYVSLHTADPGETASLANECAYTGYARAAVARSSAGWTVAGNVVSPAQNIDFPVCLGTPGNPATHFGVSRTLAGAPDYIGTLTPNIAVATNLVPRIDTTSTITED